MRRSCASRSSTSACGGRGALPRSTTPATAEPFGGSVFQLHSFRARVLATVVGLLVVVQGAVLLAVHGANLRQARRHVAEALELTARDFRRSLDVRERILLEKARLLSSDFAFKQVI